MPISKTNRHCVKTSFYCLKYYFGVASIVKVIPDAAE